MKKKQRERVEAVMEGRLPIDELTAKELKLLEEFIFVSIQLENSHRLMPHNSTIH